MHPTSIKGCLPNSFKSGTCPNQGKEGGGVWNAAAPNFLLDKFSSRFQGGGEGGPKGDGCSVPDIL